MLGNTITQGPGEHSGTRRESKVDVARFMFIPPEIGRKVGTSSLIGDEMLTASAMSFEVASEAPGNLVRCHGGTTLTRKCEHSLVTHHS